MKPRIRMQGKTLFGIIVLIVLVTLTVYVLHINSISNILAKDRDYRVQEPLSFEKDSFLTNVDQMLTEMRTYAHVIYENTAASDQFLAVTGALDVAVTDDEGKVWPDEIVPYTDDIGFMLDLDKNWMHIICRVEGEDGRSILVHAVYDLEVVSNKLFHRSSMMDEATFMLSKDGIVILSLNDELIGRDIFEHLNAEQETVALDILKTSSSNVIRHEHKTQDWYLVYTESGVCDWLIAYRIQAIETDYIYRNVMTDVAIVFALSLLCFALIAVILKMIYSRGTNEHKLVEQDYRACRTCLRMLAGYPGSLVFDTDIRTGKTYLYGSFVSMFGRDPILTNFPYGAARAGMIMDEDARKIASIMDQARKGVDRTQTEVALRKADGNYIICIMRSEMLHDEKGVAYRVISRMTEKADNVIDASVDMDETTQLPARRASQHLMEKVIRENGCSLMLIDVDNSAMLDEKLGYEEREKVIAEIAEGIKQVVQEGDILGRTGVDEFVLLMRITDEDAIYQHSKKIQKIVGAIGKARGFELSVSAGCSIASVHGTSFDELYFKADTAQYIAKQRGKKRMMIYSEN